MLISKQNIWCLSLLMLMPSSCLNGWLKTLPCCKSFFFFLLNFVYIHHLSVSRPIVLKSLYLTKRNAVWESLVICRACHHEGFLKFGDSTSALASRQLKSERNARQVSKAYTILQRKDIWVIRFWKLDIFFSFLIFSFFLFIG